MRTRLLLVSWLCGIVLFLSGGCRRVTPPEVKVEEPVSPLVLTVEPASIALEPGVKAKVKVTVARLDFSFPVKLEVHDLPPGVTATPAFLNDRERSADIELIAAPSAAPHERKKSHVSAASGDARGQSPNFAVSITKPSFSLTIEPAHLKVPQGESRPVKVTVQRKPDGYQGPVEITLANLPKNVKAVAKGNSPADSMEFVVQAGADATKENSAPQAQALAANQVRIATPFTLTVQGPPFTLKAEPAKVNLVYGRVTYVKITAVRNDYQGPIQVKLENLPAQVKAKPLQLLAQQTSGEIELVAIPTAVSLDKTVQVRGTNATSQALTSFDLKVEGRPFTLQAQVVRLDVVQGASAKMKINVIRSKDYSGPIDLEVRNLPKHCKAISRGVSLLGKDGEIEIAATEDAAPIDLAGIQVVGTATISGDKREVKLDKVGLRILGPFALQVQPGRVEMLEGIKSTLKVSAERRTYKGPIAVELRNLPDGVTATKAEIGADQQSVELELNAAANAGASVQSNVHVLGTPSTNKPLPSGNFTVVVVRKLFDLKTPPAVKITFGGKATLKVSVERKNYDGPIALELKNLPAQLKMAKTIVPAGQNETEIEITAANQAKQDKGEIHLLGTALAAGNQQVPSPNIALDVQPGLFDLLVEPVVLLINHGGSGKVKVSAVRKGHEGPITVELKNLPNLMKADKVTLPAGQDQIEVEVKAQPTVTDGNKVDVFARGTVVALSKQIDSPRFTVNVVSIGQPPGLELKVEPALIKLVQGSSMKVKVHATRKGYTGPIAVDLRNLPADVEATKGMIAMGEKTIEITLTAKAKAEPGSKADVCALGIATAAANCPYASPHITVAVLRK